MVTLAASITAVGRVRRRDLTAEHARADGFDSLADLHSALDMHYPGLDGDDMTDVVTFRLC